MAVPTHPISSYFLTLHPDLYRTALCNLPCLPASMLSCCHALPCTHEDDPVQFITVYKTSKLHSLFFPGLMISWLKKIWFHSLISMMVSSHPTTCPWWSPHIPPLAHDGLLTSHHLLKCWSPVLLSSIHYFIHRDSYKINKGIIISIAINASQSPHPEHPPLPMELTYLLVSWSLTFPFTLPTGAQEITAY